MTIWHNRRNRIRRATMKVSFPQDPWRSALSTARSPFRHWLVDRGSLTERIQNRCDAFSVRPVRQELDAPSLDECGLLGVAPGQLAMVREVYLMCGERPVVFAHSVVRKEDLNGPWRMLSRQGNRPLGAALFTNPKVKRMPLHFKQLDEGHVLYRRACCALESPPDRLWARRSLFTLHGKPILVTEVFLPDILRLAP